MSSIYGGQRGTSVFRHRRGVWKYVGSQWKEASDNVTMTLALPLPGYRGRAEEERARMGSGPLDGR
ncbi:MAG: hypothetical protein ACLT98_13345 [Eggerthellaceae bacterium]